MAIVAGIDEAGLGPVLGPLVVSAAAFEVPDSLCGASMWRMLAPAVSKKVSKRRLAVAVADSKRLYSSRSPNALRRLEHGVLSMLAARGDRPADLRQLLGVLAPSSVPWMSGYRWYDRAELALPRCAGAAEVSLAGNAVSAALRRAGLKIASLASQVLFVGQLNDMMGATRNKSTTLFDVSSRLLVGLWAEAGDRMLRVSIDNHGGRIRYLPALQRLFAGCRFKVIDETDSFSAYRIADGARSCHVTFVRGAEDKSLPVALASMMSKYLRELFMILLNRYWGSVVPGIRPTAGYYVDGRRFYGEILPAVRDLGVDRNLLYRCR